MARLMMRRGPNAGMVYELTADIITIGRGTKNDIVIDNDDVSRDHCRLLRVMSDYELEDMNSNAGTFINGLRVTMNRILHPTCLIELGDTITLEYERGRPLRDGVHAQTSSAVPQIHAEHPDAHFLILDTGREPERIYTLQDEMISIGRDLSNDIVVQDPEISRWHLQVHREDNGYTIKDMGSTNGTAVNGIRLSESRVLNFNDTIEIGSSARLRYVRNPVDLSAFSTEQPVDDAGSFTVEYNTEHLETREAARTDLMNISRKRSTSRLGSGLNQGALENHVFIAYAREDWESIVAPLTLVLQDAGIDLWVDQYLVQGGNDWMSAIEQAMHECWLLVVVMSPEALESRYVKLEYRYFINREKPVVPFLYRDIGKMPKELNGLEVIRYDKDNAKRSFQRIILEILHKRA